MQFLFVVLMSVLVGASALPHLLQAPNRPSFSLRKNTSFSVVAIPKFLEKVAQLEKKLAELEESQKRKLKQIEDKGLRPEAGEEVEVTENATAPLPEETPGDRTPASTYTGPRGSMTIDEIDLKACVCGTDNLMECRLWVNGHCSDMDDYVSISARTETGLENAKNFRCKEMNRFTGFMPVRGGESARVTVTYRDQKYEKYFSLTNNCGSLNRLPSSTDEE